MKFNVPSKTLYSYVSAVSKIINPKNTLTVLNNFLFTLRGERLTIRASDMENSLEARLTVSEPEGEGDYCIDARRLVDLLKEMPDQGITFEIHEDSLMVDITYPNGTYNLVAISGREYPHADRQTEPSADEITFTAEASSLIRGIDNSIFAVGNDALRPIMSGILWDIKPDKMVFVATDTHKLVRFTDRNIQSGVEGSVVIPVKTATVFKNAFAKEGVVTVTADSKSITLDSESFTFKSVLVKGTFPDYNRVIPTNNPFVLTVDRVSFLNAVRRVGTFVAADHGLIKFNLGPDLLTLRATDNNYCISARESVACDFTGNDMTIGFSAPYLIEIANVIPTSDLVIKLADPSRPGVFLPAEDRDNTDQLILLMPMAVID